MLPLGSRDFLKAALQRLESAEVLLREGYTLDAQYLGGYATECALKALIIELTPATDRPAKLAAITSGASMHKPEVLLKLLKDLSATLPAPIAKRVRRFDWSTDLRYQSGRRDTGETKAFLTTVQLVVNWVEGQLP